MEILYEDNHLLIVAKPAGVPVQADDSGDPSLHEQAKAYLKTTYQKPGNVFLGVVHRLDRPVSGVVLFARTGKAAARLSDSFRRRDVTKEYAAVVEPDPHAVLPTPGEWITLVNHIVVPDHENVRVFDNPRDGAKRAELSFRVVPGETAGGAIHLDIRLVTGVKHQIRAQLAAVGLPVCGDFRYGPFGQIARPEAVLGGRAILLHARRLAFPHPTRGEIMTIKAPLPEYWPRARPGAD